MSLLNSLYQVLTHSILFHKRLNYLDCSSEEENTSDEERRSSADFKDLESFQKATFKKKLKCKRKGSRVQPDNDTSQKGSQVGFRVYLLRLITYNILSGFLP